MMRKDTHFGGKWILWHKKSRLSYDGRDWFYVANCLFGDFGFDRKDGDIGLAFSLLLEFDDTIT